MSHTLKETSYMFKKYCRENNRFKQDVIEALMWFYMINDNADSLIFGGTDCEIKDEKILEEISVKDVAKLKIPLKAKFRHFKRFMKAYDKY